MRPVTPQTRLRLLFYLVFTVFGLFHAEVLSRSQPWVLLNPLLFLLVAPVYAVHYVILGDLLLRRRATGFFPVFLAGCLLGMYEFAITKVFWTPTWVPMAPRVMEVAWMEVFWVGFWWHAFMSFAIPFFLVRKLILERNESPWKIKEVRYVIFGVPLVAATLAAGSGAPITEQLASTLLSLVVLVAVSSYFLRKAPAWGFTGPDDVLLGRTGRRCAIVGLAAVYVVYGAAMRPEFFPSAVGFVVPGLFYAALLLMIYPFVRAGAKESADLPAGAPDPSALGEPATLPTPGPSAPPVAPADAPGWLPFPGIQQFFLRYSASFALLLVAFQLLALAAPVLLLVITILIILSGGGGAMVLFAAAGVKSMRKWRAKPPVPASA